jgi:hypothetical protein
MRSLFHVVFLAVLAVPSLPIMVMGGNLDDVPATNASAPLVPLRVCSDPNYSRIYRFIEGGRERTLCAVVDDGNGSGISMQIVAVDGEGKEITPLYKDNLPLAVYLAEGQSWRRVLTSSGHSIRFITPEKAGMPAVELL